MIMINNIVHLRLGYRFFRQINRLTPSFDNNGGHYSASLADTIE